MGKGDEVRREKGGGRWLTGKGDGAWHAFMIYTRVSSSKFLFR